jgi:hypothetical protein
MDLEITKLTDRYTANGGVLKEGWEEEIKNKYL